MRVPKASEAGKELFRSVLPADPRVEVKPMFGNLGAFVNGNMFAGLFGSDIGVKLSSTDLAELAAAGGGPFGPVERPMTGYLTVPQDESPAVWVRRALTYVASMPPKQTRAK
ncbi:MAG TPA: TfoX/Sxy family protein [Kineosporiaceae bacterium]|nr:TfoX/Sxy family protein [Kineosporiaceae bacterium]